MHGLKRCKCTCCKYLGSISFVKQFHYIYLFIYYELGCRNLLPFHMLAPYTEYFSLDIFMNLGTEFGRLSRAVFT